MLAKKPIKHSTNDHAIAIHEILREKLTVVAKADKDAGLPTVVAYPPGWDDARVAHTVCPELSPKSASTIRVKHFGVLHSPLIAPPLSVAAEHVLDLMVDVEAMRKEINELKDSVAILAAQTSAGDNTQLWRA